MTRDEILMLAGPWLQYRDSLTPTIRGDDIVAFALRVRGETLVQVARRIDAEGFRAHLAADAGDEVAR
jgi:hypothetical protein